MLLGRRGLAPGPQAVLCDWLEGLQRIFGASPLGGPSPELPRLAQKLRAGAILDSESWHQEVRALTLWGVSIDSADWVSCRGASHEYPCALWQLFHALTVACTDDAQALPTLLLIRGFVASSRVWREDVDEGLRGGHVVGTRAGGGAEQVLGLGAERGVEMEVVTTVGSGGQGTRVQDAGWGIAPPGDGLVGSGGREVVEGGGDVETRGRVGWDGVKLGQGTIISRAESEANWKEADWASWADAARCAFAALRRQWAVAVSSAVTELCSRV